MPLEQGIGCLGMLLRGVWVVLEFSAETIHLLDIVGFIGSWSVRLLSFGRWKPDPESWETILVGIVVIGGAIMAISVWRL